MRKMLFAFVCTLCLASPLSADDGLPPKMLAAVKRATVFVEVQVEGLTGSGSGFVVAVDGTSALVVTNHHVVEPKILAQADRNSPIIPAAFPPTKTTRPSVKSRIQQRGPIGPMGPIGPTTPRTRIRELPPDYTPRLIIRTLKNAAVTVVFDSGTKEERSAKAELLAIAPDYDLAVLRVNDVKDLPDPIKFEKPVKLAETMAVYTFGFPFGNVLATGKGHPAITVSKAAISSLRENDDGELVVVQIDGGLNPGNSGGPIVNAKGELVGVAVATIRNSNGIGLAIPSGPLRNVFEGRIGDIHLAAKPNAGKPTLTVEVSVIDPLNKITAVELHSIAVSSAKALTDKAGADKGIESLGKLRGTEKTKLTLEKQLASAEIPLADGLSEKEFLVQAVYTIAQGKPKQTRVFQVVLDAATVAALTPANQNPAPPQRPGGDNKPGGAPTAGDNARPQPGAGEQKKPAGPFDDRLFRELAPENGRLIGFEVGFGALNNVRVDVIKAIRPIFRVGQKEVLGKQCGTDLSRVTIVKAKEGYAVGGMMIRTSPFLCGLSVVFQRVGDDGKLDPRDSYQTEWIGEKSGGGERVIKADGTPVIGIAGEVEVSQNVNFDLVFEKTNAVVINPPPSDPASASRPGENGKPGNAASAGRRGSPRSDAADQQWKPPSVIDRAFRELAPEKGLLIGFEVSLGPIFPLKQEFVKAIRPIFRAGEEEVFGKQYGEDLNRVIVVKAQPGYAVGGMTIRTSQFVSGLSVVFLRVRDGKLDPKDSYKTDWIGERTGGSERVIRADGTPVIGLAGEWEVSHNLKLDLVFEKSSAVATIAPDQKPPVGNAPAGNAPAGNAPAGNSVQRDRRDGKTGRPTQILGGGFGPFARPEFQDQAPDNGLLIGLEVAIGKWVQTDVIKAVRPIYRVDKQETFGEQYGMPPGDVVTLKAKAGYAVGAMTVRAGGLADGLSITFMRVVSGKLDPADAYESEWVGSTNSGGRNVKLPGDGTPVIGIVGKADDKECTGLGLLFDKSTAVATATPDQKPPVGNAAANNVVQPDRREVTTSGATKILGGAGKPEFKDQAPENGLLVGLEIAIGKFVRTEVVKAVRPIYRVGQKETFGQQYGMPPGDVVTLKAKEGYAVGAITVRAGLLADGLSITFMRVVSGNLDPADSYESDWVGSTDSGGRPTKLTGEGKSVIGIVGKASDKECTGIGLLFDK